MEAELVVLADESGQPIGSTEKSTVHTTDTRLHLAFSCYVIDGGGRVLVTRRSVAKLTWPGVWSNSFCGHPRPNEATADAVRRRAIFELGLELDQIELVDAEFRYRAVDASGIVENEICPVYVATYEGGLRADPEEVMDWEWVDPRALLASAAATPWAFSPWMVLQLGSRTAERLASSIPLTGGT